MFTFGLRENIFACRIASSLWLNLGELNLNHYHFFEHPKIFELYPFAVENPLIFSHSSPTSPSSSPKPSISCQQPSEHTVPYPQS